MHKLDSDGLGGTGDCCHLFIIEELVPMKVFVLFHICDSS